MRRCTSLTLLALTLTVSQAVGQVPTTSGLNDRSKAEIQTDGPASEPLRPLAPEHYSRANVAPDMLQASIEALNAPGHAAAYRAALSEIRENLLKVRMAALIVAYKQTILAQARADLGLDEAPLHDREAQVRIHLHALEMHGVELHLPALPPGYDETGLPITLGDLVKQKGVKP